MWSELEIFTTFSLSSNDADSIASTCDEEEEFSSSIESKEFEWNEVQEATELAKNSEYMKSVFLLPCSATGICNKFEWVFLKHQYNTKQSLNLFENLLMGI